MGVMTAEDYLADLQALAPPGMAIPRHPDAMLTKLFLAMADMLAIADAAANSLYDEADPRTTYQLLPDWERVAGLPDPILVEAAAADGISPGMDERHAWLVSRLTAVGGQSAAYFIALAASLGVAITIDEFVPFGCGLGMVGRDQIGSDDTIFVQWQVNMPSPPVYYFHVGASQVGDPLGYSRPGVVEQLFRRYRPAHSTLVFNYT